MVRCAWGIVALGVMGCGGGTDTDGPSPTDAAGTEELGDICEDGIPQFDPDPCAPVQVAFEATWKAAQKCLSVDDCQALRGMCETQVSGACWLPVNTCLKQEDLSVLAQQFDCQSCEGDCRGACGSVACTPTPEYELRCKRPDPAEFGECDWIIR